MQRIEGCRSENAQASVDVIFHFSDVRAPSVELSDEIVIILVDCFDREGILAVIIECEPGYLGMRVVYIVETVTRPARLISVVVSVAEVAWDWIEDRKVNAA